MRKVLSAGTLTRLDKVVKFLDAATKGLTTDDEFDSVTRLGKIALQLQNIGLDKIKFVTLPTDYYPVDDPDFSGKVFWTEQADEIWKLLAEDKVLPQKLIGGTSVSAEGPPGSSETPTAGESPTGSESPTGTPTETPSETPSETPTASETPETPTPSGTTEEKPIFGVCA